MCSGDIDLVGRETALTPGADVDCEDWTLADFDAYAGVVPDITGDIAAGRTVFFETGEDFLDHLMSLRHEE